MNMGEITMKTYETDRLILKTLDKTYAGMVVDYYTRNKDFLRQWISSRDESFYTVECQEKRLEEDLENASNNKSLRLWIFKKGSNDRLIGTVAFNNILLCSYLSCQIGYRLDKDEINRGYITEAARCGIDVMFHDYKLHRIEANIMPDNIASLLVARKLGFIEEGMVHKYLKVNGTWQDHMRMALINNNA